MAPIQFGILMVEYQMIDAAGPLDILSSASRLVMSPFAAAGLVPADVVEKCIDIEFHHINDTMDPVKMSAGINVMPTATTTNCPPLDYLLIGGPDPLSYKLSDSFKSFVCAHVAAGKGIFTTCTGGFIIASTGVLDGLNATTNHMLIPYAKTKFPKVLWTDEKQWIVDNGGQFWTSGGACAGMDMMAHWVLEKYGEKISRHSWESLDFEPRDVNGNRVNQKQHGVAAT